MLRNQFVRQAFLIALPLSALLFLASAFWPLNTAAAAPCNVGGLITQDTTWSPSLCDPYIITVNTIVLEGVTLTIEPGTTIRFDSLKALQIRGALVAQGTEVAPITFTSHEPVPSAGDWAYILFTDSSMDAFYDIDDDYVGGSIIQHAIVEYAGGISPALRLENASPFIDNNIIRFNAHDGLMTSGSPRITHNDIRDNSGDGISHFGGSAFIAHNRIHDNSGDGIDDTGYEATADIYDNIISGNGAYGIRSNGHVFITSNIVSHNTLRGIETGAGNVSQNLVNDNTGGGIMASGFVTENTIVGNRTGYPAPAYPAPGGGIYLLGGTASNNTVVGNTGSLGGGVYLVGGVLSENTISENVASQGGGVYLAPHSYNKVTGNLITRNTATIANQGGGIFCGGCGGAYPYPIHSNALLRNMSGDQATLPNDFYNANPVTSPDLNVENNYWGATAVRAIERLVWHFFDDAALGVADYHPFLTQSPVNVVVNAGFESGPDVGWEEFSSAGNQLVTTALPYSGRFSASLCGYNGCTDYVEQLLTIPHDGRLRYRWHMSTREAGAPANDFLKVEVYRPDGQFLVTLRTWSNLDTEGTWLTDTVNPDQGAGQSVILRFSATTNGSRPTAFTIDEVGVR